MTITVGAFEAKTKLSELLDRVENGEEIVITRRGKEVARLTGASRRGKMRQRPASVDNGRLTAEQQARFDQLQAIGMRSSDAIKRRRLKASSLDHADLLFDERGLPR